MKKFLRKVLFVIGCILSFPFEIVAAICFGIVLLITMIFDRETYAAIVEFFNLVFNPNKQCIKDEEDNNEEESQEEIES